MRNLFAAPVGHEVNWAGMGTREAGDLISGGKGNAIEVAFKASKVMNRQNANLFLLEDINVEVGSVRVHLTLFDQKLLILKLR